MHLVILQQVDQLTEFGVVRAISDCLLIWREFLLASTAERPLFPRIGLRQTFATGFAGWPWDRNDSGNAGFADRQARNVCQRRAANTAICRENGDEKGSREGAGSRNR